MKRKYADIPTTKRILKRRYAYKYLKSDTFEGDISILYMDKIREPLVVTYEHQEVCIMDTGYIWVQHFPTQAHHSLTTMINQKEEVVQFYFDIAKSIGRTENGIPYLDDLYLDVVCIPNEKPFVLDEDELEDALDSQMITQNEYDLAHREAKNIIQSLQTGTNNLINDFDTHFELMKKQV